MPANRLGTVCINPRCVRVRCRRYCSSRIKQEKCYSSVTLGGGGNAITTAAIAAIAPTTTNPPKTAMHAIITIALNPVATIFTWKSSASPSPFPFANHKEAIAGPRNFAAD